MAGETPFAESLLCVDEAQKSEQYRGPDSAGLELHALRSQLESMVSPGGLIGVSSRMQTIHTLIGKATNHTFPVIILGETGTGKELVARCIHNSGSRKRAPLVVVDCSSLAPTLIESELFGHIRGAFTGADTNKKGLVEAANEGTLFLVYYPELSNDLAMKIGSEYKSERVTPGDFEKLAEEVGLAKPLVRRRVPEVADRVVVAMSNVAIANPVAEAVSALTRKRCETTLNRFRN